MTLLILLILDADDTADTADTALKILSSSKIESPPWRLGLCATSFNYLNIPVTDDCGPLNTLCPSREQLKCTMIRYAWLLQEPDAKDFEFLRTFALANRKLNCTLTARLSQAKRSTAPLSCRQSHLVANQRVFL
jgi:hypothetical protein